MLKHFEGLAFSLAEAVDAVCDHYDADRVLVEKDISSLVCTLRSCGALED